MARLVKQYRITESGDNEDRDELNVHQLYGKMHMMTMMHEYSPIDTVYPQIQT